MEFVLGKLYQIAPALEALASEKMNIKASRRVMRFLETASAEVQGIEAERIRLVKEYGEDQGDGKYIIPDDKREEFASTFNELLSDTVDLPVQKIPEEWLENVSISPAHLIMLDFLIEQEGEKEKDSE